MRESEAVRELTSYGCLTRMHVVRLLAPGLANDDHTKDVDFSPSGIRQRWQAGYADTRRALAQAPWQFQGDPLDGVILHEPDADGLYRPISTAMPAAIVHASGTAANGTRANGSAANGAGPLRPAA